MTSSDRPIKLILLLLRIYLDGINFAIFPYFQVFHGIRSKILLVDFDIYNVAGFDVFMLILCELLQRLLRIVKSAIHIALNLLVLVDLDG